MFIKSMKQLWEEVVVKAESWGIDLESAEMKLLKEMAERVHAIEIEFGMIEETAPGEYSRGMNFHDDPVKDQSAAGVHTATDQVLAAAGKKDAADPATFTDLQKAPIGPEPVWDGKQHVFPAGDGELT
ncbi:MAG TPA: hypothetical protein PK867_26925 [Pirellulales bacterium]|nr:hypothetical protein [Pirellulales bacterium]